MRNTKHNQRETVKEGDTYGGEIELKEVDIEAIPSRRTLSGEEAVVVFDLATTGNISLKLQYHVVHYISDLSTCKHRLDETSKLHDVHQTFYHFQIQVCQGDLILLSWQLMMAVKCSTNTQCLVNRYQHQLQRSQDCLLTSPPIKCTIMANLSTANISTLFFSIL